MRHRLKRPRHRVTIPRHALAEITEHGWSRFPFETGGILLGTAQGHDIHIRHVIGPGPNATHERYKFTPDAEWQAAQVAELWSTDTTITYLGDWHTHPEGTTRFSHLDEQTARDIAAYDDARQPNPVMLVLALRRTGKAEAAAARLNRDHLAPAQIRVLDE